MSTPQRTIAIFDFDGTLVKGDSFFPFLGFLAGWHRLIIAFVLSVALYVIGKWKNPNDPAIADHRTFIKVELLKHLVAGHSVTELPSVLTKLCLWQKWNEPVKQSLMDHHAQGHHIVVASGGLDLYLATLLKDVPVDSLICTRVGIENNILTGVMTSGNCVRQHKADMVAAYLSEHGPFDESWGYGNSPHDLPMLSLLKHRIII
jgi:HAD superfamily hydrolase (TIGR01490 family)